MKEIRLCLLAGALVVAGCTESPTAAGPTSTVAREAARQQTEPQATDLVLTPNGWRHRDCVYAIPDGAHVHHGLVTRVDGSTFELPTCSHASHAAGGTGGVSDVLPAPGTFVEYGSYDNGTPWGEINASWHVPTAPRNPYTGAQVFFAWIGLEPFNGNSIFQPVLTYGDQGMYGGNYWTATSFFCGTPETCAFSSPVLSVSAGDSLTGSVTASSCADGVCTWTIGIVDVTTGGRSHFSWDTTSAFVWAFGGASEENALTACALYPANGVSFTGVGLYDQSNTPATPHWGPVVNANVTPACVFQVDTTTTTVKVFDDPGPNLILSGPATGLPGTLVTVTAAVSYGVPPYSYGWSITGGTVHSGCGTTSTTCTSTLGPSGTFTTFSTTVTDADGFFVPSQRWPVQSCKAGGHGFC